ncbi:uncharacterized protein LOC142336435 isoform X2 [Convolutriloba macropyga]|uniref:uncharacterized protein LOC142336435 isoform X2 n=1 Tax=Convolutriloba macropyga TaxID=536237 RepID=UPI003F51D422
MEDAEPSSPQPYEPEEPQMSNDQVKAMSVLEESGGSGSSSTAVEVHSQDPEMSHFALQSLKNSPSFDPENDIEQRIHKANEDLAKQPQPVEEREKRIKFKENLIDFEAPPDENPPMSPDSTATQEDTPPPHMSESEDSKESGSGDVLVEKEGKFELLDESEDKGHKDDNSGQASQSIEDILNLNDNKSATKGGNDKEPGSAQPETKPEKKSRPGSAPYSKGNQNTLAGATYYNPPSRPKSAGQNKLSRGHRSEEMIQEAKEQAKQRQKEQSENQKRQKEEKEAKERENRDAFEAWCREKDKTAQEQRKKQRDAIRRQQEEQEDKDPDKDPFKEWLNVKNEQEKKERLLQKYQKEEDAQWVATRSQKDCDKAYRRWLKQKRRQELEEKSFLLSSRASSAVLTRKSRKSAQMAQAIKLAQQFKFIDHYGYRY